MSYSNIAISALVDGLLDGGCSYTTNVPGSKSQDIFSALGGKQISINERIAYEMAYGASLAGKRSVAVMKNTGLSSAADPFLHSVLAGISGGLVLIVVDDIEATSSPERQDSRSLRDVFGGLWIEPSTINDAYETGYNAFFWSEKLDIPIVIRITNQFYTLKGTYKKKIQRKFAQKIKHTRSKYISYWKKRDDNLQRKKEAIQLFVDKEKLFLKQVSNKTEEGIIVVGNCQRELDNNKNNKLDTLHISTYPFPNKQIIKFAKGKTKITVLEQGNDYAKKTVQTILYPQNSLPILSNTGDRLDSSDQWIIWDTCKNVFNALKKINPSYVVGDEGQFTDESTKTIEACLCMGSSVGITIGLAENGVAYPFCVTGDGSFLHNGIQALIEAFERKSKMGIIILDNNGMQSTGGQRLAADIYNIIDKRIPCFKMKYSQATEKEFANILKRMRETNKLSILYIDLT